MSLPRGFCQDFMYILVAKSKEMAMKNVSVKKPCIRLDIDYYYFFFAV